ncbi:hypothetical protein [Neisseria perflava]|uniref:hypothetical protein n=1 Tax=Neisseria perflava TaxID=33053 RepID=UPI00209DD6D9|nr:hypothetical protein [Neisseria perflava]
MNRLRLTLTATAALLLAACATTPEQKAARAEAQKRHEQELQVALAAQCDQETAKLIQQQFALSNQQPATPLSAEQQAFRLKYIDKVSAPMFQACYKMAWQNYISQQKLRQIQRYYDWDDYYPFRRHPYWWW